MNATCKVLATMPMPCPLCHVLVPANTPHVCATRDPWRDTPQPPGHAEAAKEVAQMTAKTRGIPPARKKR